MLMPSQSAELKRSPILSNTPQVWAVGAGHVMDGGKRHQTMRKPFPLPLFIIQYRVACLKT